MRIIQLTKGKQALVSDRDYPRVSKFKWQAWYNPSVKRRRWYARAFIDGRRVYLHRFILGEPESGIDHRDTNGLNNQRSNLRLATSSQNAGNARRSYANSSGFKGVSWSAQHGRWRAQIKRHGIPFHLGLFTNKRVAAWAYQYAARLLFKEFARAK